MTYFAWLDDYSVGDAVLDSQHQKLIALMNDLYALLQEPEANLNADRVETIFGGLAAYIVEHVSYEEQRMADMGYPADKLAAHRQEHNDLVKKVRHYQAKVQAGERDGLKELLPYLYGDWLINHICQKDRDYTPYLEKPAP
jgi:hemerythrin